MRYGKIQHHGWCLEFRFNWKESKYDVFALGEQQYTHPPEQFLGLVWKNPKKSRQKPCWEAIFLHENGEQQWLGDSILLRQAAITLLEHHLSQQQESNTDKNTP